MPDVHAFLFFGASLQSSCLSRASVLYSTTRNVLNGAFDMLCERIVPVRKWKSRPPSSRDKPMTGESMNCISYRARLQFFWLQDNLVRSEDIRRTDSSSCRWTLVERTVGIAASIVRTRMLASREIWASMIASIALSAALTIRNIVW